MRIIKSQQWQLNNQSHMQCHNPDQGYREKTHSSMPVSSRGCDWMWEKVVVLKVGRVWTNCLEREKQLLRGPNSQGTSLPPGSPIATPFPEPCDKMLLLQWQPPLYERHWSWDHRKAPPPITNTGQITVLHGVFKWESHYEKWASSIPLNGRKWAPHSAAVL